MKSFIFTLPLLALNFTVHGAPVINEIHYNNDLNTIRNEFVELHNPDGVSVDLSGWKLTGAIEYTFPAGSTLPASGYLVIAEDPATLLSEFRVTAFGPYRGRLNSEGERLELIDASGNEVDGVDYGIGFPWPTLTTGEGSSMELIHPGLDNDLGSSWRSSGNFSGGISKMLIAPGSDWHYRKGWDEASDPIHAWTANGFLEDATWFQAPAPIGRNEAAVVTAVNDIFQNYSSFFLRKEFTLSGNLPSSLILRALYDDGVIVWLNGTEIYRSESVDSGIIDHRGNDENNAGEVNHGTAIASDEQDGYEEYTIDGISGLIQTGTNVVAVQVFNDSIGSSDILIDVALETPPPSFVQTPPSPGVQNHSYSVSAAPNIRQVAHIPESPTSADPVTVRAKVTDPDGVDAVTLSYQIVQPGSYIRKTDAEYEQGWVDLPMVDSANDGIFSATLPAADHRELVRYRITCVDANGAGVRAPLLDDVQSNFAYFVYDGVPAWTGANEPGVDAAETFPPELLGQLPTYHLIADEADVTNSQYGSGFNNVRFLGTLVYDGEVYDHIEFEVGGRGSTYLSGKNKWRIYFNPARELEVRDHFGKKYGESWNKLTMNSCASTRNAGNRGMAGMDESLSFKVHQLTGALAPHTSYLHFRVIDNAVEASPTDQYTGDLWGLYLAIEELDGGLLDNRDLPDGNIYRIEDGSNENQAKNQPSDRSDWTTFSSQSNSTNTETWWREHMDLEKYYNFRASNRIIGNIDLRYAGNHYFYHGTNADGTQSRWVPIAWDLDMMLSSVRHWSGTVRQEKCLSHPAIHIEYQNRCREILDLLLAEPALNGGQIGQLIDEFTQILNPDGEVLTWADLDRFMWNFNPRTASDSRPRFDHFGNFNSSPVTLSRREGSWTRTMESEDFEGQMKFILDYMTDTDPDPATWSINSGDQRGYAYNFLTSEAEDINIPDTPLISYTGSAGFPANELSFESSGFSDPQGSATFAAMQWRIGEISAIPGEPGTYEIEDNWTSTETSHVDLRIVPPASAVNPGSVYRARVRHQDTSGRWSHWSAPIEFVAGMPDVLALQQSLVISEIMYHPSTGQEHEYLELHNIGMTALDLTNVRFTDGIDFDFPSGTVIGAGDYLLVVRDRVAFEALYGPGLPVVGAYGLNESGSLSNGGEGITLALGTSAIHEFEYHDRSPWPLGADGAGSALVLHQTSHLSSQGALDPLGHGVAVNWRQGVAGGSPGEADPSSQFSGDPNADADRDGMSAFMEYAVGSSDAEAGEDGLVFEFDGSEMTLTFPRNPLASDVRFLVEVSSDLESWNADAVLARQDATTATYTFDPVGGQRYFMRLRVILGEALQE
ncbi:MAG: lamin tail domain-containing protein [Akkermansiaceae bacterium]